MFCARCGTENVLRQRYCRQCGMLLLTETESGAEHRVSSELARLRQNDCQVGQMALTLRNVSNSLTASLAFLLVLTVDIAIRWQLHLDAFLLIGSLLVCAWQFRRFRGLFRQFMRDRYKVPELISEESNSAQLSSRKVTLDSARRQTAPLSVTEQTTLGLKNANRFLIPTVRLDEPAREAHSY